MQVLKTRPEANRPFMAGVRITVLTTASASAEIRTGTKQASVREIQLISGSSAGNGTFGLGRPAARGVTPTTSVTLLAADPGDAACLSSIATAWTTAPTVPTDFLRRCEMQASASAGIVWTFGPRELVIPASSSLVLWNISVVLASDVSITLEE